MQRTQFLKITGSQMLKALSGWLNKAKDHNDVNALLKQRLAPDMYPLTSQVCFSCFLLQESMFRLRGHEVSDDALRIRSKGWNIEDAPIEIDEVFSMIEQTAAQLQALPDGALDQELSAPVTFSLPDGMRFEMQPQEYLRDWTLPQFYFHLSIAYAILRNQSIPLGKADYVGHMLQYVKDEGSSCPLPSAPG